MDVLMPQLGETVKEGTISAWFKKPGDKVAAGDNLFEIETDKVSMEVQAIESGMLADIFVAAGETARVGDAVAFIDDGSGKTSQRGVAPKTAKSLPPAATPSPGPAVAPATARPAASSASLEERGFAPFNEVFTARGRFGSAKMADGMPISPLARRLIHQNNLDASAVAAVTRAAGRKKIAARDVQQALASPRDIRSFASLPPITGDRDIEPLNRIRAQTAKHLQSSWQHVPHVLQTVEVDFGEVDAVRNTHKDQFRGAHGVALTYLPFIARAVCLALRAFPKVNAAFDGERLHIARAINLGIAVDMNHKGLVVPVVKNADGLNVSGLALAIHLLAQKARDGKLSPDDMENGTYSITNNGSFGTLFTAPLINAPQVAILSTDRIAKRALVKETEFGDVIVARPAGILAQSFDHRAFDGAYAASFLSHVKATLENRNWSAEFS